MKIFAALLASSEAWSLGSCSDEEASGFCRNECSFKWLGRREKINFKQMGKHENGFLAQATALSWQDAHLSKEGYYTGMLRFDRAFCKTPILRAIGAGTVVINVFDRTDGNYAHEAQFYEPPKNGDKNKEAAFVQFRRSGYLQGDMLFKGKDRFFIEMTNVADHHEPLNPANDNVSHDDYWMCFRNVGLLHQADVEQEPFFTSDYSKCAAYTRYGQDKNWGDPETTAPPTTTTTTVETLSGGWEVAGPTITPGLTCERPGEPWSPSTRFSTGMLTAPWNKNRIVGGATVEEGSWPWIVGLNSGGSHWCGGTAITKNAGSKSDWILTAGHCCKGETSIKVTIGDWSKGTISENEVTVTSKNILIHPNYDPITLSHDFCMIEVPNLSDNGANHVAPCLPAEHIQSHKKCYTAGWGTTSYGGSTAHKLQAVGLWIFSQDYCENTNNAGDLDDSMFCAGIPDFDGDGQVDGGKDACQGDSGGPLVCENEGQVVLYGVVSWGYGCAAKNNPGVWGTVAYAMDWIMDTMNAS